jgi:tripartite-type tricarboxylate transporter receptor subunit TctC
MLTFGLRRVVVARCFLLTALALFARTALAADDDFPARPIQVIITSTPGSTSDLLTRFLGAEMSKTLGQPVVVISKASESGTIGADAARRAAPDGYTLFLGGNTTMAANVHLVKNLTYDPLKDFAPVSQATINPLVLVVRAGLSVKSVAELVAYAKARPGQMNYGVGNAGGKVAVQLLRSITGVQAQEISYKGASQAMTELVAGRLDFMAVDPGVADVFLKQGSIRALAVTSRVRLPSMDTVPTMEEAGVPGYEYASWLGYYAPAGTPEPLIRKLNAAFVKAINAKPSQDFFYRSGMLARPSTPQALTAFNKEQVAVWERLVRIAGLQPQ